MAGSLMGGKMVDLASVNAQEHMRRDVVSISLHVCYGFSACRFLSRLFSPSTPLHSSLLPLPPRRSRKLRPITWATAVGSFVVHHHKDSVHM